VTVPRQERRLPAWVTGLIRIALTVVVTWFILDRIGLGLEDFRELDAGEWRPSWGWLAAATALLLVTNLLAAVLWGLMVRDLGGPRVTPGASVRVYFLSNLGRYIPGKVWQIAGMAYLGRAEGVPPATATAAAILCQAFTLAGAALFGTGALIAGQGRLRDAGIVALGVIVLGLGVAMIPAVHRRLVGLWKRTGGQAVPGEPRIGVTFPARWTGAYLVVWMVQGGAFWLLALSFGQAGSLWTLGPAYAAAYLFGYLVFFAPAGIGVRESFLIAFLQPVVGPGAAGALAVIARLWSTVVEVVPAAIVAGARITPNRTQP
jgi:uncharacterized membrane protein YbhN (UPF0104 family)